MHKPKIETDEPMTTTDMVYQAFYNHKGNLTLTQMQQHLSSNNVSISDTMFYKAKKVYRLTLEILTKHPAASLGSAQAYLNARNANLNEYLFRKLQTSILNENKPETRQQNAKPVPMPTPEAPIIPIPVSPPNEDKPVEYSHLTLGLFRDYSKLANKYGIEAVREIAGFVIGNYGDEEAISDLRHLEEVWQEIQPKPEVKEV